MFLRWLLAALHLLALGIGFASIWARVVALRSSPLDTAALKRVFKADNFWALAAALWLGTGLLRAFAGFEKGAPYYLDNYLFYIKMALFILVVGLETRAISALGLWRRQVRRGEPVDLAAAPNLARISVAQAHILVVMVLLATAMARGIGGN